MTVNGDKSSTLGRAVKGVMLDGRIYPVFAKLDAEDRGWLNGKLGTKWQKRDMTGYEIYAPRVGRD